MYLFNNNKRKKHQIISINELIQYTKKGNRVFYPFVRMNSYQITLATTNKIWCNDIRELESTGTIKNINNFSIFKMKKDDIEVEKPPKGINPFKIKDFNSQYMKGFLPALLPSVYEYGPNGFTIVDIIKLSGYIVIDLDHLSETELQLEKVRLMTYPYVSCVFLSPRGEGLKVICKYKIPDNIQYNELFLVEFWKQLNEKICYDLNTQQDESAKDVNRVCYMSYDIDIQFQDATEFNTGIDIEKISTTLIEEREEKINREYQHPIDIKELMKEIFNFIKDCRERNIPTIEPHDYESYQRICAAMCNLVDYNESLKEMAFDLFLKFVEGSPHYWNYEMTQRNFSRTRFDSFWVKSQRRARPYTKATFKPYMEKIKVLYF